MDNYPILRRGDLTPQQVEAIVKGGALIPGEYPLGTPIRISLELARNNYLREVENRYLRFIKWVITGAAVVTIVGLSYINYTLDKVGKKIEQTTVELKQSFNELHTSFTSLEQSTNELYISLTSLEKTINDSTNSLNKSLDNLDEISRSFEMMNYQISGELKKMNEGLNNVEKDLRGTQADLERIVEPNSIQ